MTDINSLKEIKIIKQSDRQKISLVKAPNGKQYLKREISEDKREIYKTLQKINHPSIPKVYYVGFKDKTIIIEEYIQGTPLSALIENKARISKKQIRYISKAVLSALDKLHQAKIIHRDVKPDNILINEAGQVWLTDYEIARIYRNEIRKDTEAMGTFGYAPIEQYGMLPTDFKTDIYAFGVTLKTLLNYSKVKGSLHRIADKCKLLDPSQRYKSAKDVNKAIERNRIKPIIFIIVIILAIISGTAYWIYNYYTPPGYVRLDEEMRQAERFVDFETSKAVEKYRGYEGYDSLTIFGVDSPASHLLLIEDTELNGKIKLGRANGTLVNASVKLDNGTLSVALSDPFGHSFAHEFKYDPKNDYELLYSEDRRNNADIVCWDTDDDGLEELLIGINDVSFKVDGERILSYVNYSEGWCVRYNEAIGFTLCEGDMFSKGTKFWLYKGKPDIYLPYYSATAAEDHVERYMVASNTVHAVRID